jgi:hypothetical protein
MAAEIIKVMHEEYLATKVPIVSLSTIAAVTRFEGDLSDHLRYCKSIWNVIVGRGARGKVKFLVLPAPEANKLVFRTEE